MTTPPFKSLKSFQLAARHGSFAAAANELCITASAVSHQIRRLEEQLGVALFVRHPRALAITAAGSAYLQQVEAVFAQLESATAELRARFQRVALRLQVPPFFAQELLLPRLALFSVAHPETDLQVVTRSDVPADPLAEADVTVAIGDGRWPDVQARCLFPQAFVPACAPRLLAQSGVVSAAQLALGSLIVHTRRGDLWGRWAEAAGIEVLQPRQQLHFDTMSAVVDAAERGVGFALVSAPLARQRFASGTLQRVFPQEVSTGESYYVVQRLPVAARPEVRALGDWLVEQFASGPA
jgi:LysR family glycine cleavage system transcriptional activator